MSAISAPQPVSIGITSIADRQKRQQADVRRFASKAKPSAPVTALAPGSASPNHAGAAQPVEDDEGLSSDTLFTAALIANRLPLRHETADEVMLRRGHEWQPPSSSFQLKDKTI